MEVKWTAADADAAEVSRELQEAAVLMDDELSRLTFFTKIQVETEHETFELTRTSGELSPWLRMVGGNLGGKWLVRVVDIFVDEDEEPSIAFRYLYPACELPESEIGTDFDVEYELAVGSCVHTTSLVVPRSAGGTNPHSISPLGQRLTE